VSVFVILHNLKVFPTTCAALFTSWNDLSSKKPNCSASHSVFSQIIPFIDPIVGIQFHLLRGQLNTWRVRPSRFVLDPIHRMPGRKTKRFRVETVTYQRVHRRTLPRTHPSRCCAGMAWQVPEPPESYTAAPSHLAG